MTPTPPLTLSQSRLTTFLACQRRFQLRYLRQVPWPPAPVAPAAEAALERGQQFHRLLERQYLGLPVAAADIQDPVLRGWWADFQAGRPALPAGRFLTEISLTVPVGPHRLSGRFDLVVMDPGGAGPVHILDWKTGRPQPVAALRQEWQTRLYLALMAAGGGALAPDGAAPAPDQIALTYWYVAEPAAPRTVRYSSAWHARNWAEISQVVAEIEARLAADAWPLTTEWARCRDCSYQIICGRQAAGPPSPAAPTVDAEPDPPVSLEPELP